MKWRSAKIDHISTVVTKGTTPTTYGMPFTDSGVNFIKAEALNGDPVLDEEGFAFIALKTHEKLKRSILEEGDVLITIAGAQVGKCGVVKLEHLPANTNQAVGIIRVDSRVADPRYVYYYFKNPTIFQMCQSIGGGQAAQPNINLAVLGGFSLPLPDLDTQHSIAAFLSNYDNLIENNRRRIALLEQAARLLYEEWFVRFHFPGHEHAKIINGLPVGWKRPLLGTYAPLQYGKALREDFRVDGEVPVYGSSGRVGTHSKPLVEEGGIIIGRKGTVGAVYFSEVPFWPIDTAYYIDNENVSRFLFYALQRLQFINTDVAVPGLNRDFAHSRNLIVPTDSLLNQYEETVGPLFCMAKNLERQNDKLQQARDLLLPRLMSGEVEV